jgi:thioester reductase-like protein
LVRIHRSATQWATPRANILVESDFNQHMALYSHCVVERVSLFASQQLSIPVVILRLGQVCGGTNSGAWSATHAIPILIKASTILDSFPAVHGFSSTAIQWIPSDIAAQAIHDILANRSSQQYSVYNVANPHPIPWSQLVPMLQKAKVFSPSVRLTSLDEWIAELEMLATQSANERPIEAVALLPFFKVSAQEARASGNSETRKFITEKGVRASRALETCPEFNERWMQLSVDAWRRSGFLPDPNH